MARITPTTSTFAQAFCRLSLIGLLTIGTSGMAAEKGDRWTSSKMRGTPDAPPPYRVEAAFPKLKFNRSLVLTSAPGTERLFVAEQDGKIFSFDPKSPTKADLVVDLKKSNKQLRAIYGLTFHPQFAKNRQVFICYVLGGNQMQGTRVARFQMTDEATPKLEVSSERVILTWSSGGHNGGCLKFGPDGYLYITAGDGAGPSPPDSLRAGQDVSNVLSTVMRIDINRNENGRGYGIPADNPFIKLRGARPEIWAYGFRNPWKMSFDRKTGDLWVGDVGWELWEMIYRVKKGGNYGWSVVEARQSVLPGQKRGPTPILPPTLEHPHSEAGSITGGFVYRGSRLSSLHGAYIYGDYQSGIVWGAKFDGERLVWNKELARTPLQLVGFGEDHTGELFLLDHQGQISRLIKNNEPDLSESFPRVLSATGLFRDTAKLTPNTGVLEYDVNAHHWADNTTSRRWLALPPGKEINVDRRGVWQFPDGAVLSKTVSLKTGKQGAATRTRLETQVLHREKGAWRPYTYAWNDEQNDATLVDAKGFTRVLKVPDAQSKTGARDQTYRFSARNECSLCHNPWVEARTTIFGLQSASALGVSLEQLNRNSPDGKANQLEELQRFGWLSKSVDVKKASSFADPYDTTQDLGARARAYLHVNCFHCHQFNAGGAATIALGHSVPIEKAKLLNERPTQGAFRIDDAQIVAPGNPHGSVLLYRVSKLGGGRMPRLGSQMVDLAGIQMIRDWIARMPTKADSPASNRQPAIDKAIARLRNVKSDADRQVIVEQLTSSTRGALTLFHLLNDKALDNATRRIAIQLAAGHQSVEVRDLFEGFLPADQRVKRLGDVVDRAKILQLEADVTRGRRVFFSDAAGSCKNCHRIQKEGKDVGPDLSTIGKKYKPDQLLQHILEPSRTIDPKYVSYTLETASGRFVTGLLVLKTEQQVTLRDAQGKTHQYQTDQIERLVAQRKSIMPELLLRDMTAQQVADLLAFLSTLK